MYRVLPSRYFFYSFSVGMASCLVYLLNILHVYVCLERYLIIYVLINILRKA